jgi:hypothetical protein
MADPNFLPRWTKARASFDKEVAKITLVNERVLTSSFNELGGEFKDLDTAIRAKKLPAIKASCKAFKPLSESIGKHLGKAEKDSDDKDLKGAVNDLKRDLQDFAKEVKTLFAQTLAQESQEQAMAEQKSDWKADLSGNTMAMVTKLTYESGEYNKFKGAFEGFLSEYSIGAEGKKLPVAIWAELLKDLTKSGYIDGQIPHVAGDPKQYILAEMGDSPGKIIRTKLLKKGMEGLQPFIDHADKYLDKVIKTRAKGSKWAFWSGVGAKESALKEAKGGIVLEGTVGAWFDKVWDFEALTGGTKSLVLWSALSELYAKKAAEYFADFEFIGFVGAGATRDQSVFNKIEQPTFIQIFNAKATVPPPSIEWYVTECEPDGERWKWTGKASTRVGNDRGKAIDMVKKKYGG